MNPVAAAALAAAELICEFSDGYRKSLLAAMAGDPPRTERTLVYDAITADAARVLASGAAGRKPVLVRADGRHLHFIQPDGPTVRVTTLTECTGTTVRAGIEACTRFAAHHAWHFDATAAVAPAASFARQPTGAALGSCEPWQVK